MPDVYIGVDSGATRTSVSVQCPGPDPVERAFQTPEVIAGTTPVEEYAATLDRILTPVERIVDAIPDVGDIFVFIGSAGFAAPTRSAFLDALTEVVPHKFNGKVKVAGAANDGTALLLGHDADAIVIAGTGSIVLTRDAEEQLHAAGGHDWVGCDYGSGFWIGLTGIRASTRAFEAGVQTTLYSRFREEYAIGGRGDEAFVRTLRELALADQGMKGEVAKFAASVCRAAEAGDEEAQDIVKTQAEDLANVTAASLRRFMSSEQLVNGVKLVECGGLFGSSFYKENFRNQVENRLLHTPGSKVSWETVDSGRQSVLNLARRLAEPHRELGAIAREFVPAIARF